MNSIRPDDYSAFMMLKNYIYTSLRLKTSQVYIHKDYPFEKQM